ncbi:MAG TPA: hypothetical protein VNJ08_05010 [Bacteriovoracaceae bacterium]|nr:hypothetical protein [Bacteriovoracaceae bacterium]
MQFPILGLFLLLLSGQSYGAPSRGPAVEDFVGIEVEHVEATPNANEPLFNLEHEVSQIETVRKGGGIVAANKPQIATASPASTPWSLTTILALVIILSLPLISWALVMNHMRNKASEVSSSNIQVLQKFREERELSLKKNKDNEIKKAS